MALNEQIPITQQVSADARTRLTEYAMDFEEAFAAEGIPWAEEHGDARTTVALEDKFPMPVSKAEFKKLFGEPHYRRLAAKMLTVTTDEWEDGVEEYARLLESTSWLGWGAEPKNMAAEARLLPNRIVALLLVNGLTTASWENPDGVTTIKWFDTAHPNNPFDSSAGTFSNFNTNNPLDADGVDACFEQFRGFKGPNGKTPRGMRLTHLFVGSDLERKALRLVGNERILVDRGDGNTVERYNDIKELGLKVVVCDEFTETGVWYAGSLGRRGGVPWVTKRRVPAFPINMGSAGLVSGATAQLMYEWIVSDKSSDKYKHGVNGGPPGFVSIAAKLDAGGALAHPWTLIRNEPS